jgi:LmbE family N-acetylglucosaminyl deacetylase/CheY-like chemotaxis protein
MDGGQTRGRILLVDDDLSLGAYLARVLRTHGRFEVTHELDAAAALRGLETEQWDLLITDIEMPGMTGLELIGRARRLVPGLPVAVLTGHATVEYAVTALRHSAAEFLAKPVAAEDLITAATTLIEAGRRARAASTDTVLAVGAHPGDIETGAGGTLLAHRAAGDVVAMLILSPGSRDGGEDRRVRECQRAADVIGARLFLTELDEAPIPEGDPTIGRVEDVIAEVRPTVLYAHSFHDVHPDHRNAHRAVMAASAGIGQVYCYQAASATIDFRPAHFVAIDRHVGVKVSTIEIFGSQRGVLVPAQRGCLETELIESTARYWSRFGGGSHAEAFEVVRHRAGPPPSRPRETRARR